MTLDVTEQIRVGWESGLSHPNHSTFLSKDKDPTQRHRVSERLVWRAGISLCGLAAARH